MTATKPTDAPGGIRTPKLYFHDTGLAASLIGIQDPDQLFTHPLRGSIFENWVVPEILKQFRHRARNPRLFFYQERGRLEVDVLVEERADLTAIEVKAGQTPSASYFTAFQKLADRLNRSGDERWRLARRIVVYGGDETQSRGSGELLSWRELPGLLVS